MERISEWLKQLAQNNGSDLYLSTGAPPCAKFNGKLQPLSGDILKPGEIKAIAYDLMDASQRSDFERDLEINIATSLSGYGRFRINVFVQRNEVSLVARYIVADIPSWQSLGLPDTMLDVVMRKRGLVLFVGATGSGKSTSLAAMLDYRNTHSSGHIITVEDPIEFTHKHKKSIFNQREIGVDTRSWQAALKSALRQAPDVIMIGEIRDRETMEQALAFAETGHLCLSTLHANNANQALDRIVNLFPEDRRPQLLLDLAQNLQCVVSQRLVPSLAGGRVAAMELMLRSPLISDLILRGQFESIKDVIEKSNTLGMQSFDQACVRLYEDRLIDQTQALRYADSANNVRLKIKFLSSNTPDNQPNDLDLELGADDR